MKQCAHLSLREGSSPCFCRPRPIPFAIKEPVGKELDHLESAGILRKVHHSDWAATIVPVPKKRQYNSSLRGLQGVREPYASSRPVTPTKP